MEILLLAIRPTRDRALPALDLLHHSVRVGDYDVQALVSGNDPDVVLVDARHDLLEARDLCRILRTTGLRVPLLAVVEEAGLIAMSADWGLDDVVLSSAGPAEVEARLRMTVTRIAGEAGGGASGLVTAGELAIDPHTYSARAQGPHARPHLQGVRAAEVPRPAPGPGVQPRSAAARGLGLRLLRRSPHGRRARPPAARQARQRDTSR